MFQDIFKPKEAKDIAKKLNDAEIALEVAGDMARRCLGMEEFKVYRESFKRAEEGIMDSLISYNHYFSLSDSGDISKYALKVSRLLTKVESVRKLLSDIESNAKRGLSKKGVGE